MSQSDSSDKLTSSLRVLCDRLYEVDLLHSELNKPQNSDEAILHQSDFSNQENGYVVLSIYFFLLSVVGFAYISSLRYRVQTCRDAIVSLDLDKQLSIYVYALPILAYMVLQNVSAIKSVSQIKCDVCMFGLISGIVISLYKGPSTKEVKVTVWTTQARRCVVWVPSWTQNVKQVQAIVADALNINPVGRVCFSREGAGLHAMDLSVPFSSILGEEGLNCHDFFGFSSATCHVIIQSQEAYKDALALISDIDAGPAQSPSFQKTSMLRSVTRVFKRGDSGTSLGGNRTENIDGDKDKFSPSKKGSSSWMSFRRSNKRISGAHEGGYESDSTTASNVTPGATPRKTPAKVSNTEQQLPHERHVLHVAPQPRKHQVEAYVDAILRDPTMNLPGVPDKLEKKVYTIAISMALRACLKGIFSLNGKLVMGHHVELEIREGQMPQLPTQVASSELGSVEELVDELLKEEMINITWLPDKYEKPLYVNVIMVVLTVMNSFFAATKVDILGHVLEMKMSPSGKGLKKLADKICSTRRVSEDVLEEVLDVHFANAPPNWIPDSFERPMYKTIYALVLCVIDEIFKDMRINFLGDECLLHLVPGPMPPPPGSEQENFNRKIRVAKAAADAAAKDRMVFGRHDLILSALVGALMSTYFFR